MVLEIVSSFRAKSRNPLCLQEISPFRFASVEMTGLFDNRQFLDYIIHFSDLFEAPQ